MITVLIKDDGEPKVVQLTYENLWRELKDIPDAQLIVTDNWVNALASVKTKFVSFVEADCLVNSGYFKSMTNFLRKKALYGRVGFLASAVGVNTWGNKVYGYSVGNQYTDGVQPVREKKSKQLYPVQIGYLPGAVLRVDMFKDVLNEFKPNQHWEDDLVYLSAKTSFGFWNKDLMVYVNPNSTYVTTEDYVSNIGDFDPEPGKLIEKFNRELI